MTHVSLAAGEFAAACGDPGGEVIPLEEALAPDGRHFDCPACLHVLRGGKRHAEPQP